MDFRDELPPVSDENNALPHEPKPEAANGEDRAGDDLDGLSALLIEEAAAGLPLPVDEEPVDQAPAADTQPAAPVERPQDDDEPSALLLDDMQMSDEEVAVLEAAGAELKSARIPTADLPAVDLPAAGQPAAEPDPSDLPVDSEASPLLLDDDVLDAPEASPAAPSADSETEASPLLVDDGASEELLFGSEFPPPEDESRPVSIAGLGGDGPSALLLDAETTPDTLPAPSGETAAAPPAEATALPEAPDDAASGLLLADDETPDVTAPTDAPPDADVPPSQPESETAPFALADEASDETPPEAEPSAPADTEPQTDRDAMPTDDESNPLLLDDVLAPEGTAVAAPRASTDVPAGEPLIPDLSDDASSSALLTGSVADDIESAGPAAAPSATADAEETSPAPTTSPSSLVDSLADGGSSLLLGSAQPPVPTMTEPPVGRKGRRRRRGERIKAVTPKPGKPVEWFSNARACAAYCRKHRRALLLYFTTGDVEQCQTYEEAIRRPEMQSFLGQYVCCTVDVTNDEGRQAAMRLAIPTDGPALVLLAPSGREYARLLKPEIDWEFLATVLFWTLR